MKLRWSDRARQDLKEIGRFIARDSRDAARKWVSRLRRRAIKAAAIPQAGRIVPEFGKPDIREVLLGNYRIVYQMTGKTVTILTVFEGHRLLPLISRSSE
ncbi:MAG TPA: type II toxin-antitoxin system RelE/ParE family toxin [Vicinamibacteria bacterium]